MQAINPKLIVLLILVIAFAVHTKLSNPLKTFSTQAYWQGATIESVYSIPDEALLPGNKNGAVLMWAAMVTDNPEIISALVKRGADVNEADIIFSGTPLSAAAGESQHPVIIDKLIELGADVDKVVGSNDKTPLIIAAELNPTPEIIERLVHHGANVHYKDLTNRNALEQAIRFKNEAVIPVLEALTK